VTVRSRLRWWPAVMFLAALAWTCDRAPATPVSALTSAGAAPSPPPIYTPVGPVPGPRKATNRPTNPYAEDASAMTEGRVLFNRFNCAGCHGDHAGGGMGPSLRDVDWLYGNSEAQVFSSIAEGRAHGMPAWGTRLNEQQIWKLVAYIKSLRTSHEPQPPS